MQLYLEFLEAVARYLLVRFLDRTDGWDRLGICHLFL